MLAQIIKIGCVVNIFLMFFCLLGKNRKIQIPPNMFVKKINEIGERMYFVVNISENNNTIAEHSAESNGNKIFLFITVLRKLRHI
jgi:hypothetical protein